MGGPFSRMRGIQQVLDAMYSLPNHYHLTFIGDGELAHTIDQAASSDKRIKGWE